MKYYWCVSCGYHGIFDFFRYRNIQCESCNYDGLTEYDEEEWKKSGASERHEANKNDPYYDGHLKYNMSRHAIRPKDSKVGKVKEKEMAEREEADKEEENEQQNQS